MKKHKWLAKIHLQNLTFVLGGDWVWRCYEESKLGKTFAQLLTRLSHPPNYILRVSDGEPGRVIAHELAKKYKGKVEYPPGRIVDVQAVYFAEYARKIKEQKALKEYKGSKK